MKAAYEMLVATEPPEEPVDAIALTVADVFRWLEDEDQFIRPKVELPPRTGQEIKLSTPDAAAARCGVCGQPHPLTAAEPVAPADRLMDDTCEVLRQCGHWRAMPMVDVLQVFGHPYPHTHLNGGSLLKQVVGGSANSGLFFTDCALVATAEPNFITSMRSMVQPLTLPVFEDLSPRLASKSETERRLAPYALLATLTRSFVSSLVRNGLNVASLEASTSAQISSASLDMRGHRKSKSPSPYLLTPSHIIRGLVDVSQDVRFVCMARMGTSADLRAPAEISLTHSTPGGTLVPSSF